MLRVGDRIWHKKWNWSGVVEQVKSNEDGILYDVRYDDPGLDNEWCSLEDLILDVDYE